MSCWSSARARRSKQLRWPSGTIPGHRGDGALHLAFAIGKDEFDETHLTLRGVAVEGRNDWEHGGRSIYFRDPDEHLLELATPGLWSNVLGARPPPSNS